MYPHSQLLIQFLLTLYHDLEGKKEPVNKQTGADVTVSSVNWRKVAQQELKIGEGQKKLQSMAKALCRSYKLAIPSIQN